jgi:hypothetical protein
VERFEYEDRHEFIAKLEEMVKSGMPKRRIHTFTPYHVHEAEEILDESQSHVRFFAGVGAVTGLATGFAFTIFTVLAWPMITGGKPLISIPAFLIIGYELTILFGCLLGFFGFLALARLPVLAGIPKADEEFGQKFVIQISDEVKR